MSDSRWNDDWREELEQENEHCYIRLCECRNTRRDMKTIAKLMYKYNPNKTKEECLWRTIEWITDWNNQYNLDPTEEEFKEILNSM